MIALYIVYFLTKYIVTRSFGWTPSIALRVSVSKDVVREGS